MKFKLKDILKCNAQGSYFEEIEVENITDLKEYLYKNYGDLMNEYQQSIIVDFENNEIIIYDWYYE